MKNNPLENAMDQLEKASKILQIDREELEILETPKKEIHVQILLKTADGNMKILKGYRVQHNDSRGPFKGGIRFHPKVDLDEIKALSFWMSIKTAVLNIPYGGSKGGIAVNSKELSANEIEKISRAYVRSIFKDIGPDVDIPAPDVYTNPQIMAWMADEYSTIAGQHVPGAFTGKPVEVGGSKGRDTATAQGGIYVLMEAIKKFKFKKPISVAIQGFGNAGANAAKILHFDDEKFKIVAVSDSGGAVYNEKGIDVPFLLSHKKETGAVTDFKDARNLKPEELLELEVDILIPAALEGAITLENAKNVKAKILLELANGPITKEAEDILLGKNILIIPDVLANAGGVTVSYFEWTQNKSGFYLDEEEIQKMLSKKMREAYKDVLDLAEVYKIDLRTAAYVLAISRIVDSQKLKGLF
ncbi:MAG: Glutamate dehydrogenase [candidate division CPR2 bacterium GW2011_GWC1_39_9]|uniref:Glutamate dehydrogenase n=1 Tax=candidate division CPR2 bacterium GW2011_GWC2_39_10 TaxID=1618345 RepID=A0A0G0P9J1_UNCC2|nr:MAG: Glutamate dehydrogenase [candidate division CPR2 bacterium GW2011_GWC2_39_10]KKR34133.1 MAG: Glutamate dehydrogenase [candidate division CPR2 bacterium GW2011_GWC1_39_9]